MRDPASLFSPFRVIFVTLKLKHDTYSYYIKICTACHFTQVRTKIFDTSLDLVFSLFLYCEGITEEINIKQNLLFLCHFIPGKNSQMAQDEYLFKSF